MKKPLFNKTLIHYRIKITIVINIVNMPVYIVVHPAGWNSLEILKIRSEKRLSQRAHRSAFIYKYSETLVPGMKLLTSAL